MPAYSMEGEITDAERNTHRKGNYQKYFERRGNASTVHNLIQGGHEKSLLNGSFTKRRKQPEPRRMDEIEEGFFKFQRRRQGGEPDREVHQITSVDGNHLTKRRPVGSFTEYRSESKRSDSIDDVSNSFNMTRAGVSRNGPCRLNVFYSTEEDIRGSDNNSRPSLRILSEWRTETPEHNPSKLFLNRPSKLQGAGAIKVDDDESEEDSIKPQPKHDKSWSSYFHCSSN